MVAELQNFPALPEELRQAISDLSQEPSSVTKLHCLLMTLFKPWNQTPKGRDFHALGYFLRFSSIRKDGDLSNLAEINQLLVKLIFLIRLVAFSAVEESPDEQEAIFEMIRFGSVH